MAMTPETLSKNMLGIAEPAKSIPHRQKMHMTHAHSRSTATRANPHIDSSNIDGRQEDTKTARKLDSEHVEMPIKDVETDSQLSDTLSLLAVSGLWATYSPALRYMYMLPGAPSPAALTATRAVMQAVSLWPLAAASGGRTTSSEAHSDRQHSAVLSSSFWRAGLELGLLNFAGTAFQAVGLESTSATRAAFLVQSTSIFTPLLDGLTGGAISATVWLATVIGATGAALFTFAQHDGAAGSLADSSLGGGDVAVLAAALCYSLTTIRIGRFAQQLQPLQLAFAKSIGLAALSAGWLAFVGVSSVSQGRALSAQWEGISDPVAWAALVLMAAAGAAAAFLQTTGQRSVAPARAQVLFSTTPLWSTFFAVVLLQEDALTAPELAGGVLIVFASLLAAR